MNIEMKCPLEIGDEVYFTVIDKHIEDEIECPFCHGNSIVDTGVMAWQFDEPLAVIGTNLSEKSLILTCKNCGGTGKIKYRIPPVKIDIYGTLTGIHRVYDINNWDINVYTVTGNDSKEYYVFGKDLRVEE